MKFLNENRQSCEILVFFLLNKFRQFRQILPSSMQQSRVPALNFYHMFFPAIDNHVVHRKQKQCQ